jgi:hypothetical protein
MCNSLHKLCTEEAPKTKIDLDKPQMVIYFSIRNSRFCNFKYRCEEKGKFFIRVHGRCHDIPGTREVERVDDEERGSSGASTRGQISGKELPELGLLINALHEDVLVRVLECEVEGLSWEIPEIDRIMELDDQNNLDSVAIN